MLQSMGSLRVRHDLATEQQQNKDPELCYVNDLTISLLHSSSLEGVPTSFLSSCVSLPCFCLK